MLNLEYLQTGKLNTQKSIKNNTAALSPQEKDFYLNDQDIGINPNKRADYQIIYKMCYEILQEALKLQQEQIKFQKENEGKRHGAIANKAKSRTDMKLKKIDGKYYIEHSIGSSRQISIGTGMSYGNTTNKIYFLRKLEMLEYDKTSKAYYVTPKGLEFMVIWEQMEKVFPYTKYVEEREKLNHGKDKKKKQESK